MEVYGQQKGGEVNSRLTKYWYDLSIHREWAGVEDSGPDANKASSFCSIIPIMNGSTLNITFDQPSVERILAAKRPTVSLWKEIKNKLLISLPDGFLREGSKSWWEREHLLAKEDIRAGRVKSFDSIDEFIKSLPA